MYRKRNGSMGFSFTKFANAAVPNLFADAVPSLTTDLEPLRRDMLYSHQLASVDFFNLDERSILVAGVVESERLSKNAFKALQKHSILDPDGKVNTYKIGPNFVNQLAVLSIYRQKELVNMLFWWEEECHRFRKLKGEDEELKVMIQEAEAHAATDEHNTAGRQMVDQLKFARERVRMKIRQRPSQRRQDTEADTDDIMDRFRGRAASAPMVLGTTGHLGGENMERGGGNDDNNDEPLPDYSMVPR